MACRDCPRCSEPAIVYLVALVPRVLWGLLTCWNLGLFSRNCPQCGHRLRLHQRIGGRLAD